MKHEGDFVILCLSGTLLIFFVFLPPVVYANLVGTVSFGLFLAILWLGYKGKILKFFNFLGLGGKHGESQINSRNDPTVAPIHGGGDGKEGSS